MVNGQIKLQVQIILFLPIIIQISLTYDLFFEKWFGVFHASEQILNTESYLILAQLTLGGAL